MKKSGKGISLIYYPTGMAGGGDTTQAHIRLKPSGGIDLYMCSCDIGQGIKTIACQICADETGVPYEDIVIHNDETDKGGVCSGTFASRVTYYAGNAVINAAADLRKKMFEYAAPLLGVPAEDLAVGDGMIFSTKDAEKKMKIADLAGMVGWGGGAPLIGCGYFAKPADKPIDEATGQIDIITSMGYGATSVEVEVDTDTGEVTLTKIDSVFECGKIMNPLLANAQVDGGVVMAIGGSLTEDCNPYFPTDEFKPRSFGDYIMPTFMDVPPMTSQLMEFPSKNGPYGAKGIGEMTTNSLSGAIANAIHDAVGVWLNEAPFTPNKILAALDENAAKKQA